MFVRTRFFNLVLIIVMAFGALGVLANPSRPQLLTFLSQNILRAAVITKLLRSITAREAL